MKTIYEIQEKLNTILPESTPEIQKGDIGQPWISVYAGSLLQVAKILRDDPGFQFDTLMCLSGIHFPELEQFGVAYHLHSTSLGHNLAIKAFVPVANPVVLSIEKIWKTADWHEREAYDMFGIIFEGHPHLQRILCPDDWEGHPLRKDYVQQESYMGITTLN